MQIFNEFEDVIQDEKVHISRLRNTYIFNTSKAPLLDPETSEITNIQFIGCLKDCVCFCAASETTRTRTKRSKFYFEYELIKLLELSQIENVSDISVFARKYGPLFGTKFSKNLVIEEPISLWFCAAKFSKLMFYIKAGYENDEWDAINRVVQIDCYKTIDIEGQSFLYTASSSIEANNIEMYMKTLLESVFAEKNYWVKNKITEHETQWDFIELKDRDHIEINICLEKPPVTSDLKIGSVCDKQLVYEHATFRNTDIPTKKELVSTLIETLICLHTGSIEYDWISGTYKPIFKEQIKWLWFCLAKSLGKIENDYCHYCGKPFIKNRIDKIYCSRSCQIKANKH